MKKKRGKKIKFRYRLFILLVLIVVFLLCTFPLIDKRFMPTAIQIMEVTVKTKTNEAIDRAVKQITVEGGYVPADFYTKTMGDDGRTLSIAANTILINDLCSDMAVEIAGSLSGLEDEEIKIPLGAFTGFQSIANRGPTIPFSIRPKGTATVDYDTVFVSAGINQMHFQIFLTIETQVNLVNPLQENEVLVTRRFALVDTYISGEIPEYYFPLPQIQSYE